MPVLGTRDLASIGAQRNHAIIPAAAVNNAIVAAPANAACGSRQASTGISSDHSSDTRSFTNATGVLTGQSHLQRALFGMFMPLLSVMTLMDSLPPAMALQPNLSINVASVLNRSPAKISEVSTGPLSSTLILPIYLTRAPIQATLLRIESMT